MIFLAFGLIIFFSHPAGGRGVSVGLAAGQGEPATGIINVFVLCKHFASLKM